MIYSTSRCPHCNQVIQRETNPTKKIGNPLFKCPHCGKNIIEKNKKEWATMDSGERFFYFANSYTFSRAFFVFIISLGLLYETSIEAGIVLGSLLSIGLVLLEYTIRKDKYANSINESLERTGDLSYRKLLKELNFTFYDSNEPKYIVSLEVINRVKNKDDYNNLLQRSFISNYFYNKSNDSSYKFNIDEIKDDLENFNAQMNEYFEYEQKKYLNSSDKILILENKKYSSLVIKWSKSKKYDKETIVVNYNGRFLFFIIDSSKSLNQMFKNRGMDTLKKDVDLNGEYIVNNLPDILQLPPIFPDELNYLLLHSILERNNLFKDMINDLKTQ